ILAGNITPTHLIAVMRKRPYSGDCKHPTALTPSYCVRHAQFERHDRPSDSPGDCVSFRPGAFPGGVNSLTRLWIQTLLRRQRDLVAQIRGHREFRSEAVAG